MKPAIVVPYRNRQSYLDVLLQRLPRYLEEVSGIEDYGIFIAEQADERLFRLALARNVGARFALEQEAYDYIVFHDVDVIPISGVDYRIGDKNSVWFMTAGSVKVFSSAFLAANGYSPDFAGWGYEDTDFIHRLKASGARSEHWPATAEAKTAAMLNLELRPMTEQRSRQFSKRYFGYRDQGPIFLPYNHPEHGAALSEQYNKSDFFNPSLKLHNTELLKRSFRLSQKQRHAYYQQHGVHQVDLSSVRIKNESTRITWLSFDSEQAGGPPQLSEILSQAEPKPAEPSRKRGSAQDSRTRTDGRPTRGRSATGQRRRATSPWKRPPPDTRTTIASPPAGERTALGERPQLPSAQELLEQLIVIENFASAQACQRLSEMHRRLRPSTRSRDQNGASILEARTRDPDGFELAKALVQRIIAQVEHRYRQSEIGCDLAMLTALTGGFRHVLHADNAVIVCPRHGRSPEKLVKLGCRCTEARVAPNHTPWRKYTGLLYLSEAHLGGNIVFGQGPNAWKLYRREIRTRRGLLVLSPSNELFFHQTTPVKSGIRYSLNCWFTDEPARMQRELRATSCGQSTSLASAAAEPGSVPGTGSAAVS